jgi:hypothetical protein
MKRALQASILLLVVLALVACATFTRDAYRTLTVSQQTYDTTLSVMGDLYREGKVTEAQKAKAIELGRAYKLAHNGAVAALVRYEEQGGQANKDAYMGAAADAAKALSALLAYCRPLLEKGVK